MTPLAPLAAAEVSPEHIAAELCRRFPGVRAWLGGATGTWWAIARDRTGHHRLLEAATPAELGRRLEDLGGRRLPQYARTRETSAATGPTPARPRAPRRAVPSHRPPGAVEGRSGRRGLVRRLLGSLIAVKDKPGGP